MAIKYGYFLLDPNHASTFFGPVKAFLFFVDFRSNVPPWSHSRAQRQPGYYPTTKKSQIQDKIGNAKEVKLVGEAALHLSPVQMQTRTSRPL